MKTISLPEINFNDQETSLKDYEIDSQIQVKSPKTLSYVVRWQLARDRSGSAKTKNMSEISGTTAKPWKQKGTGRARQGSKRSVQFVGGRTCHGPVPRDFDFSIPKKIAKLAVNDAIKIKVANNEILTFKENSQVSSSKLISRVLVKNNVKSALIISDSGEKISLGARNLKNIKIISLKAINALDLVKYSYLVVETNTFATKIMGALR